MAKLILKGNLENRKIFKSLLEKDEKIFINSVLKKDNITELKISAPFLPKDKEIEAIDNPLLFFDKKLGRAWINKHNLNYLIENKIRYVNKSTGIYLLYTDLFTLNNYQKEANKTAPKNLSKEECDKYGCMKLAEETGELSGMVAKHYFHNKTFDKENLKEELGDLLWYIALLSKNNNLTLSEIASNNISKLRDRHGETYNSGYYKDL